MSRTSIEHEAFMRFSQYARKKEDQNIPIKYGFLIASLICRSSNELKISLTYSEVFGLCLSPIFLMGFIASTFFGPGSGSEPFSKKNLVASVSPLAITMLGPSAIRNTQNLYNIYTDHDNDTTREYIEYSFGNNSITFSDTNKACDKIFRDLFQKDKGFRDFRWESTQPRYKQLVDLYVFGYDISSDFLFKYVNLNINELVVKNETGISTFREDFVVDWIFVLGSSLSFCYDFGQVIFLFYKSLAYHPDPVSAKKVLIEVATKVLLDVLYNQSQRENVNHTENFSKKRKRSLGWEESQKENFSECIISMMTIMVLYPSQGSYKNIKETFLMIINTLQVNVENDERSMKEYFLYKMNITERKFEFDTSIVLADVNSIFKNFRDCTKKSDLFPAF